MAALSEQQIASAVYYPIPLHRQNVFADIEIVLTTFCKKSRMVYDVMTILTYVLLDKTNK